jgi:Mg2+-importing ATPase
MTLRGLNSDRPELAEQGIASSGKWITWLIGGAIIVAVIVATLNVSEQRELIRLAQEARPRWLWAVIPLQALTYAAQSQVWRAVVAADGGRLPMSEAYRLSLAKLFVDQTIPTGGIGGTLLYIQSIERAGVRRGAAFACMAVTTFSYYGAYALCLIAALIVLRMEGYLKWGVALLAALFMLLSMLFSLFIVMEAGRQHSRLPERLKRMPLLYRPIQFLRDADPRLARNARVLSRSMGWQLVIVGLDAASLWCLLQAVGFTAPVQLVFASYMFASLFRTLGVLPGGLGTFEAASVLLLGAVGVPAAAGLSATLLFRGFSFWLPMLPGLWIARRMMHERG